LQTPRMRCTTACVGSWEPADADAKLAWMRAGGVVSAEFDGSTLRSCTLGPAPTVAEVRPPQPEQTPEQRVDDQRRTALAAGPRLVARAPQR